MSLSRALLLPSLREVRESQGYSQAVLAKRAGVSRKTVLRAEQGHEVRITNAGNLARALGVPLDRLRQPASH